MASNLLANYIRLIRLILFVCFLSSSLVCTSHSLETGSLDLHEELPFGPGESEMQGGTKTKRPSGHQTFDEDRHWS